MTHLIYLHQGHRALPSYLIPLAQIMAPILDGECYIAEANSTSASTMWGIEAAANRVVDELMGVLDSMPEVQILSFVGVSLGGCILRRAVEKLFNHTVGINRVPLELRYFITIASPLNGFTPGFNFPTFMTKMFGWLDSTFTDLYDMHDKTPPTLSGLAMFHKRICIANLTGDWRVPLTSALPVGGNWPWSAGSQRLRQQAIDGTSCIWETVILDISDKPRVHHAIVTDSRTVEAIRRLTDD